MPERCVAGYCSNGRTDTISLHNFPKDKTLSAKWTKAVRLSRDWEGPTQRSVLCSAHFTESSFVEACFLKKKLGFKGVKMTLKDKAVPTIFNRGIAKIVQSERGASVIRKRKRDTKELLAASFQAEDKDDSDEDNNEEQINSVLIGKEFRHTFSQTNIMVVTSVASQAHPVTVRSKSCQTTGKVFIDQGCQTETHICHSSVPVDLNLALSDTKTGSKKQVKPCSKTETGSEKKVKPCIKRVIDKDYKPSPDSEEEYENECEEEMHESKYNNITESDYDNKPHKEPKFIIFLSMLMKLLTWLHCPGCGHPVVSKTLQEWGTLLVCTIACVECSSQTVWYSQPFMGAIPAGNILLSAAILTSGSIPAKSLKMLQQMGVQCISSRTFFRHQQGILHSAISTVWSIDKQKQHDAIQAEDRLVVLGGDGRCDSMGFCAKFGTYTFIELDANKIIETKVSTSTECGNSGAMELHGLKALIEILNEFFTIKMLVTDRHRSVAKWVRENLPNIMHVFDIWHVAKGISRKLDKAAKSTPEIKPWIRSIINHLYWSATSTPDGQGDVILAKWQSIMNHITDKHIHENELFPECVHGVLDGDRQWIRPGSYAARLLEGIVLKKCLQTDISKLSGTYQTYSLEAFHSLLIQFCPKQYAFSYDGMTSRTFLAALHYNENSGRAQATTTDGRKRYSLTYPKFKKGDYTVRNVPVAPSYEYVDKVMMEVAKNCLKGQREKGQEIQLRQQNEPLKLCAHVERPEKALAVQSHIERFN